MRWSWVCRDLIALWPHYYSEPAVRRRAVLHSQCSSPPAWDDVHEWGIVWQQLPLNSTPPPPPLHIYTHTLTSSWEIGGLCFLSGCPQRQTSGASCLVGIWSSHSPSLQMRRKTRPEEDTAAHPLLSSPIFSFLSLSYTPVPFPSSLSSVQPVDSVNWLTQSQVHWLRSLIKGLLIGTLFNTGPCSESCPLILSWQQPFPVCQSLNVINYVGQLRRFFFLHSSSCCFPYADSWKDERNSPWEHRAIIQHIYYTFFIVKLSLRWGDWYQFHVYTSGTEIYPFY